MRNTPTSIYPGRGRDFIVQSEKSGNGKTLTAEILVERQACRRCHRVPILTNECNRDEIVRCFIESSADQPDDVTCGYIIDISPSVTRGVMELIFEVLY